MADGGRPRDGKVDALPGDARHVPGRGDLDLRDEQAQGVGRGQRAVTQGGEAGRDRFAGGQLIDLRQNGQREGVGGHAAVKQRNAVMDGEVKAAALFVLFVEAAGEIDHHEAFSSASRMASSVMSTRSGVIQ
jgi:hypothetical protein